MISNTELNELQSICKNKKVNIEQLLEETVAPLQKKISKSQGQLIGALTRNYEQCSHGMTPVDYTLKETLYTGIISPETKFPQTEDLFTIFLLGINKPYSLDLNSNLERDFKECYDNEFTNNKTFRWNLLYFMDKPTEIPENSWEHGCYGSHTTCLLTKKPRLELYIGNKQTIPFLQEKLEGWRYLQLSKLLEYNLPVTENITKKIEKEQLQIFDKIKSTESEIRSLTKEKKVRLENTTNENYMELTNTFVENLKSNPQMKNSRYNILRLLETAIKRGYHENGVQVEKQLDAGITMNINLKDFFAQRKKMFKL